MWIVALCLATLGQVSAAAPAEPPGSKPATVEVNSQKSLTDAVGDSFPDVTWEYPAELLPRKFPRMSYVSGPGDRGLNPKAAWRKPVVLKEDASSVEISINCFRRREGDGARADAPGTPAIPLREPDYRYKVAKFHDLRAVAASADDQDVLAFRDGDLLFKIEASGAKAESRREATAAAAEAIWKFRHPN